MSDNHFEDEEYKELHKTVSNNTEGGACLNGRCRSNYETVSCSYRYQGLLGAEKYKHIYNAPDIKAVYHLGKEKKRSAIVAALSKKNVRREIAINGVYRVVDGGKERRCEILRRKDGVVYKTYEHDDALYRKTHWFLNFTVAQVPWPNQVHHVLNHSSLFKVVQSFKNIPDVVSQGLLKELYNINHKDNVVILPTKDCHARLTGLPKHGSHPSYSKKVLKDVSKALREYKNLNKSAGTESHPKPDPLAVKAKLLEISDQFYKKIIAEVPKNKLCRGKPSTINNIK